MREFERVGADSSDGTMKPVVLHVSEAFGGGIVSAVAQFARLTSDRYYHLLAARSREDHETGHELSDAFDAVYLHKGHMLSFGRSIRNRIRSIKPDVIHLHSTWAGLVGRLVAPGARVVYSPHCFGFERRDVAYATRLGVRALEMALAPLQGGYAAIGQYESNLARGMPHRGAVWPVPNSAAVDTYRRGARQRRVDGRFSICMVGRAAPQKGVDFFLATIQALDQRDIRFLWLGGGHEIGEARLRATGVELTGWQPRERILGLLAHEIDLYFHTAAWEGTPITLLEAAAIGLPILCRRIPHLADVPVGWWVDTPTEAAAAIRTLATGERLAELAAASQDIQDSFSPARTREALLNLYDTCRAHVAAKTRAFQDGDELAAEQVGRLP